MMKNSPVPGLTAVEYASAVAQGKVRFLVAGRWVRGCRDLHCYQATLGPFCVGCSGRIEDRRVVDDRPVTDADIADHKYNEARDKAVQEGKW